VFAHGFSSLFQVTVYGGLNPIAYLSLRLRKCDVHISTNLSQLRQTDALADHRIAVRANADKVPRLLCYWLVFRHVTRRPLRDAAADTVDLSRLTGPFVSRPAHYDICGKVTTKNQNRAFPVIGWKPSLDPCAHSIFVGTEQAGDLFHRVIPMDFDQAVIGASFGHGGNPLRLHRFLATRFQLGHQIANIRIGLACYACSIQSCNFTGGPAHGATTQAHRFGEQALGYAQVDCAPGEACARNDARKPQYGMRHVPTSLSELGPFETHCSWATWARE